MKNCSPDHKQAQQYQAKLAQAAEDSVLYTKRKAANHELIRNAERLRQDLESVGLTLEQFGQATGENPRLPLGFNDHQQLQQFVEEFQRMFSGLKLPGGGSNNFQLQIMGSSTSFYSNNPKKDLGHHWDKSGIGKSDYDIDIHSPELARAMLLNPESVSNDKIVRGGQRVTFSTGKPGKVGTLYDTFPQLAEFATNWKVLTGRDFEFKLKLDLRPIASLPQMPNHGRAIAPLGR